MEPKEGVEEGKTSSTWSSLAPDPPFLRDTPTLGWTVADGQLLLPHTHTHSRTYIHKHTSHCQSQHLPLESRTAVCVTSAAASWAEVLSEPLTSLRINAEASGCVDLNHKEACWSRGSDFPGLASGLYKLQGAGRCSDLSPERLPAREAPLEQLSHSTHHVPGNGPARVGGWGWMDSWTLHLWQLYLEWSSEHKQGSGRRDPCVARI